MGHGAISVFTQVVASAGTSTAEFDLGRTWENVFLVIQSMTSNSQLFIKAADVTGGTYRRVTHPPINSSTVACNEFSIVSSITNHMVPIPNAFRFLKVEQTATADSGQSYKIICGD